jgi:hypothetical protein
MKVRSMALAALLFGMASAQASVVSWNTWSTTSAGSIVTGNGTVGVTFSGPAAAVVNGYPSYTPASTWADGSVVNNAPTAANGILQIMGGSPAVQTITFSTAVVDPVFAIWSLGQPSILASFIFRDVTPVFVAGGPNAEYGGSTISVNGNAVQGREGNGTVRFIGTYTSLSWTNPQFENWYGFDVGITRVAAASVPEPASIALVLGSLGVLTTVTARARRRS